MDFSFETFNGVTQSATGLTGAIKGAADLVASLKAMVKAPERGGDREIEAAIERLALTIENARLNNALLEAQVHMLQQEIRRVQEAEAKLEGYVLYRTAGGGTVYAPQQADQAGQPAHLICPNCYEDGRRSILQGYYAEKDCPRCRAKFPVEPWSSGL